MYQSLLFLYFLFFLIYNDCKPTKNTKNKYILVTREIEKKKRFIYSKDSIVVSYGTGEY